MEWNLPPFLAPFAGILSGTCLGLQFDSPLWAVVPLVASVSLAICLQRFSKSPSLAARYNPLHYIWIYFVFVGVGMLDAIYFSPGATPESVIGRKTVISGEIVDHSTKAAGDSYVVSVSSVGLAKDSYGCVKPFKVLVVTDGITMDIGDLVAMEAQLEKIADTPISSDYARYMESKGISCKTYLDGSCKLLRNGHRRSLKTLSLALRDEIETNIEKSSLGRRAKAFVIAMICGDRSFMSYGELAYFQDAGVSHILAVSGMHAGILAGVVLWVLSPLNLLGGYRKKYLIAAGLLWVFVFVTGMSPSAVRSATMATCCFIALFLQRKNSAANALLAAGFLIILFSPLSVFDAGAQLSFLCVGCLIIFAGRFNTVDHHLHPRLYRVNAAFIVSLVAALSTWAVAAYHFRRLPLLFLPANVIVVPAMPLLMTMSLVYVILLSLGIDMHILAVSIDFCLDFIYGVVGMIPSGSVLNLEVSGVSVFLWLIALALMALAVMRKRGRIAFSLFSFLIMGGVAAMVADASTRPAQWFIVPEKGLNRITASVSDGDFRQRVVFPRGTVTRLHGPEADVIVADRDVSSREWKSILSERHRYLIIIGGSFSGDMPEKVGGKDIMLVVHTTCRRKKESELTDTLVRTGLDVVGMRSSVLRAFPI